MTAKQASAARWRAKQKAKKLQLETGVITGTLPETTETDEQIDTKLKDRFGVLKILAKASCEGTSRALIVSGPAGLSKSYTIEKALEEFDPTETMWRIIKGYTRPTGIYKALWQSRHKGQILCFDDSDALFGDEQSLNFLKASLDTTERRRISYLAETALYDELEAIVIPSTFDFEGTCIFITNYDFHAIVAKGHKLAPHLTALMSRAHYIDLSMKTRRDYYIRIKQVVAEGMLEGMGLDKSEEAEVMAFIDEHMDQLNELSLRTAIKLANLKKMGPDWKRIGKVTLCKNS
jgi:hypothetical protein